MRIYYHVRFTLGLAILLCALVPTLLQAQSPNQPPPNFKIAILADQGLGENAEAVLQLVKNEGAQAVVHSGDIDYKNRPAEWDAMITNILGPNFPYFASMGDAEDDWDGSGGLQQYLMNRLNRAGIPWTGDLGVQSTLRYQGIFFILVAVDIRGSGHDVYIRDQLAADNSIWSICSWHKNMHNLQVCSKPDETGWGVYEESRLGGALIATAHCHAYARTHLLSNMTNQTIASTSNTVQIEKGKSFVIVSGLAGQGRGATQQVSGNWWAKVYTASQNSQYGALFGTFNVEGMPNKATFYFKNIDGVVVDQFEVISNVEPSGPTLAVTSPNGNESLPAGSIHNITWTSSGFSDPVDIEYSADGGGNWALLASSTPNDGSFAWTVSEAPTTQGRIRVSDATDGNPSDVSDGNFRIVGPATQLIKVSGDSQSGGVGTALSAPFVVRSTDDASNPVSGVAVTFAVTAGGGSLSNSQPQTTNSNGEASTVLTLGPESGTNTVTATADGLTGSPQTFTATATSQPPNSNIALNKPATASSTNGSYAASRAVDGNTSTYWRSGSLSTTTVAWLRVDLQEAYTISRAVIKWDGKYHARNYQIQYSNDDVNWSTVYTDNSGNGGTDDVSFAAATGRYWRVYITRNNKSSERINEFEIYTSEMAMPKPAAVVMEGGELPKEFELSQNHPNPFNSGTQIIFRLPQHEHVKLSIFNLVGEEIETLVDEVRSAGAHSVTFAPNNLPSGLYFYILQAGDFKQVRRLVYMK